MAIRRIRRVDESVAAAVPKRKSHVGKLIVFLIFQLIFAMAVMPLLIFYGPFENVKKTLVGTSWATLNHRWIARAFMSDEAIEKLIGEDYAVTPLDAGEKPDELIFENTHSTKIEQFNISGSGFSGKMLVIHDPTRVVVGMSSQIPKAGETTSTIAKNLGAVAAINAGGFSDEGFTGIGGSPDGFIITGGKVAFSSYNGDNNKRTFAVGIDKKGQLVIGFHSANELISFGVREAVSFGPALVVNGKPTITSGDGGWGIAPRSAIGQKSTGEILLLVIDGRSIRSLGASLKDVQDIMLEYGAVNACNLDGGSSTTLYNNGKVINRPSDGLGERAVPSAFVVMP